MGKTTHLHNGNSARYVLNIPELDYCILDALLASKMKRIGTNDIRNYYLEHQIKSPTYAAFSQALSRLKARKILKIERHDVLWIEFPSQEMADAIGTAFKACKEAQAKIEAMA